MNKSKNKCDDFQDSWDSFSIKPHSFNFRGRENIHSLPGVVCSVIVYVLVISFAVLRGLFVAYKWNPIISMYKEID